MSLQASSWAMRQQTGHWVTKYVLMVLADYVTCDGIAVVHDMDQLAALCELPRAKIDRAIARLVDDGFIDYGDNRHPATGEPCTTFQFHGEAAR